MVDLVHVVLEISQVSLEMLVIDIHDQCCQKNIYRFHENPMVLHIFFIVPINCILILVHHQDIRSDSDEIISLNERGKDSASLLCLQ